MMRRAGGVLAAYLVVLQAVLAGLALGTAPVAADPFAILCDTLSADQAGSALADGADLAAPAKQHKALPNCCVGVCALHAIGVAPPDAAAAPLAPAQAAAASSATPDDLAPPSERRTPKNPRAPPARA